MEFFAFRWSPARIGCVLLSGVMACYARGFDRPQADSKIETYNSSLHLLRRGNPNVKEVALTIDDGPHIKWAPHILQTLKENNVHATFFVVGKKVDENPQLVRQMLADGNEVGNHSMTHPRLTQVELKRVHDELVACHKAVFAATGYRMKLMRPPGLQYTKDVLLIGKKLGYITVEENIAVGDFILKGDRSWYEGSDGFYTHVEQVRSNVFKQLKPGAIIVIHDMPVTSAALDSILKGIKQRGYRIVTVSEMLKHLKG